MYVENNEMTGAFNNAYKHSMSSCCITATPSLTKGDLEITFGGKNFEKLLLTSGVNEELVANLLRRKELSRKLDEISSMTKDEDFFPMQEDEPLEDLYSTICNMADCSMHLDDAKNNQDYFARSLMASAVDFEEALLVLDNFAESYDRAMEKKKAKDKKEESSTWFKKEYVFEDDGILINEDLGFKIKGEMYENLLLNTKSYVEINGTYMVNENLPYLEKKEMMQKSLLAHVRNKEHRNLKHESEADIAVLVDIVKDFATYYGFSNAW